MATFIAVILALLKAIPAIERLFDKVSDVKREKTAQDRLAAKDAAVDDLLAPYRVQHTGDQAGQQQQAVAPIGLPAGSSGGTGLGK